jgi:surfeit locus 1 family protein
MVVEVSADKTAPKSTLPRAGVTRINFRNDHLQYAITWFALAMVLIVIFGIYHREKKAPVP